MQEFHPRLDILFKTLVIAIAIPLFLISFTQKANATHSFSDAQAYWLASEYSGSGQWLDQSGNGHNGTSTNALFFDHDETQAGNYFRHPGLNNNYLTATDSAALSIAGDFDIRWVGIMDDYTPGSAKDLVGKWGTSGDLSYRMRIETDGDLTVRASSDGIAQEVNRQSSVSSGFTDGTLQGFRVTVDVDNGSGNSDSKFYTLNNPGTDDPTNTANWTQLGTTQIDDVITTIFDSTFEFSVGATEGGTNDPNKGSTYRVLVYDGIDGTIVLDANAADEVGDTVAQAGTFVESSAQAATVTINQSGSAELMRLVDRPHFWFDTDAYIEIPDHANLDFALTDNYTIGIGIRTYTVPPAAETFLFSKKTGTGAGQVGWTINWGTGGNYSIRHADGTNQPNDNVADAVSGEATTAIGVKTVADDDLEAFKGGTGSGSPTTDTTTATAANAEVVRIGSKSGGTPASFYFGELWSAAIFRSAKTDAEVVNVADALMSYSVTISSTSTSPTEGGATTTYTIVLDSQPTATTTIIMSTDNTESTTTAELIFTTANWSSQQPTGMQLRLLLSQQLMTT